uniref:Protein NLRC3-like n=1 Tax=Phallusia mammillata TaxID=59560 RepID=A0A6F9DMD2_9ASCI|nr:protein NLRC3-like [Phallusia mammillata]
MVENLVGVITQHNIHLSYLDLSFNNLNGVGKYLAKSIHLMQVLVLVQCNLQEGDFIAIAEATARRDTNMSLLNLGDNVMSKKALDSFAPGVHKLDGMGLNECSVTGDGLEQLCLEISKRQKPMNVLYLGENNIGLIGVNHVSSCVYNIRVLSLDDCNLTITCLRVLIAAILNMDHSMVYLDLSDNKFGDEGAIALATCLEKVENLDVLDCDITPVGAKALHKANRKLNREIDGLPDIPQATAASSVGRPHEVAQKSKKRCAIS